MIDLGQLVRRFAAGAKEVRLMTGQPVTVRTQAGVDLVTQHALTPRDVVGAMTAAGLGQYIPARDIEANMVETEIDGVGVRMTISRKQGQLKVRIAPTASAPGASQATPGKKKRRTFSDEGAPRNVDRVRVPDSVSPIVPGRDAGGAAQDPPPRAQPPERQPPSHTPRDGPLPVEVELDPMRQARDLGPQPVDRTDTPGAPVRLGAAEESGALDWKTPDEAGPGPGAGVEQTDGSLLIDPGVLGGGESGSPEFELELEDSGGMPGIELAGIELGDPGKLELEAAHTLSAAGPAAVAPPPIAAALEGRGLGSEPAFVDDRSGRPPDSKTGPRRPVPRTSRRLNTTMSALVATARARSASDIHFTTGEQGRVRIAGRLLGEGRTWSEADLGAAIDQIMPTHGPRLLAENGHVDFALDVEGAGRLRVNVSRQRRGLKLSLRLVDDAPRSFEALGLPPEIEKICEAHQGLAVVAGPSGHGKTTTLAAIVDLINRAKPVHVITVEDPVEVLHEAKEAVISQREVGTHTASFGAALKGALREDPDVIVIGELRDRETVEIAVEAAETGHLVLATMSTPNGPRTIDRLIELFPPAEQSQVRATLAGALKMVIAQRLVPSADGSRRHAAVEMISGNVPLWAMIRDDKLVQLSSLMQRGRRYGMITIEESLRELVASGAIDRATAAAWADDPRSFAEGAT